MHPQAQQPCNVILSINQYSKQPDQYTALINYLILGTSYGLRYDTPTSGMVAPTVLLRYNMKLFSTATAIIVFPYETFCSFAV